MYSFATSSFQNFHEFNEELLNSENTEKRILQFLVNFFRTLMEQNDPLQVGSDTN